MIFQFILAIMHLMKKELMEIEDFDTCMSFIDEKPRYLINEQTLIQTAESK